MSDYHPGLSQVRVPDLHLVRQHFPTPEVADLAQAVRDALRGPGIDTILRPGLRVALAVGSRGITGLATIVATLVAELKQRGCVPLILPAMGSHGGATVEGQVEVLAGYGVTEAAMGAPIVASMETRVVGALRFAAGAYHTDPAGGLPVPMASDALACDAVIPVVRIKPHTGFRGAIESGICKMVSIGLGKHHGCARYHREGYERFAALIPAAAEVVLATGRIPFALAVVENAAERTAMVEAVPAARILAREPELLTLARSLMPRLLLPAIDVLVVERIGKDISGAGMDPNVTGRAESGDLPGFTGPAIRRIVVLDLSEGTHGNASGLGLADLTTERAVAAMDRRVTYTNVLTSGSLDVGKIPVSLPDDDAAIRAALSCLPGKLPADATMVRIRDTLTLGTIAVSGNLLADVARDPALSLLGPFTGFGH
jgi:hypothetical protein